jgi:hypothetical protein
MEEVAADAKSTTTITTTTTRWYAIELSSWRLRGGRSGAMCHVSHPAPRVVRRLTLDEMPVHERIELAKERKADANAQFTRDGDYDAALLSYTMAVDAVRDAHRDVDDRHNRRRRSRRRRRRRNHFSNTNEMRADLVLIMATCSNNAATCCAKLGRWDDVTKHAQNALILLDALYDKRGMRVHATLNGDGNIDARLFGEYRVKSHLLVARSCIENERRRMGSGADNATDGIEVACGVLRRARDIAMGYVDELKSRSIRDKDEDASLRSLISQTREIRRLISECNERKKATRDMEKRRAMAMFAGGGGGGSGGGYDDDGDDGKSPKAADVVLRHPAKESVGGDDEGADVGGPTSTSIGGTIRKKKAVTTTDDGKMKKNTTQQRQRRKNAPPSVVNDDGGVRSVTFSSSPPQVREFVPSPSSSFVAAGRDDENDGDDDGDDRPWYSEHGEALIVLAAVAGFAAVAMLAIRRSVR